EEDFLGVVLDINALGKYENRLRCHAGDGSPPPGEVSTLRDSDSGYWNPDPRGGHRSPTRPPCCASGAACRASGGACCASGAVCRGSGGACCGSRGSCCGF